MSRQRVSSCSHPSKCACSPSEYKQASVMNSQWFSIQPEDGQMHCTKNLFQYYKVLLLPFLLDESIVQCCWKAERGGKNNNDTIPHIHIQRLHLPLPLPPQGSNFFFNALQLIADLYNKLVITDLTTIGVRELVQKSLVTNHTRSKTQLLNESTSSEWVFWI